MKSDAVLSDCGRYRYALSREFDSGQGAMLFVMLNPSTADATHDDPTIKRCIAFAKREGKRYLTVTNLYAYRATNPDELGRVADPIGPEWERYMTMCAMYADVVVCAWGSHAGIERQARVRDFLMMHTGGHLYCLGTTANGSPRHPLYLPKDTPLVPYGGRNPNCDVVG